MQFKDHFSSGAERYAKFRPSYPDALFEFLASLTERRECAWDCGTGNGQAAVSLARHFAAVLASDASAAQIASAQAHPGVHYFVAPAEASGITAGSVDLVVVAQALHWFDLGRFYDEVRRVVRPGGALAAWCYGLMSVEPAVNAVIAHLYEDILGAYWPDERRFVDARYATLPFPFDERPAPPFAMGARWRLEDLLGYLDTWSAVKRYRESHGTDPLDLVRGELSRAWGDAADIKQVSWPIHLRVGTAR